MRNHYLPFVALVAVVGTIACSQSLATSTSPSSTSTSSAALTAERLSGTWTLTAMQAAGQAAQTSPAGAVYNLTLADGRASARTDCNTCGGTFTLSGQVLTIWPVLACTRAACPTMAFENTYTSVLAGESTATIAGNTLTLTSSRGRLTFAR